MKKSNYQEKLDFASLIVSVIAGIIGFVISKIVYSIIKGGMSSPLSIAIEFIVFFIVLIVIITIYNLINDNLGRHVHYHHDSGKLILSILASLAIVFVLSLLFEFIYEVNFFNKNNLYNEPTSYIFIIDDSGSMNSNDPDGLRYKAIDQIIETKDDSFPYAVYSFNDELILKRKLAPKSETYDYSIENEGGTKIRQAIDEVYQAYDNNELDGLGNNPKFLLLSDGYATDISAFHSISSVLKQYVNDDLTISTVGLGHTDDDLMQEIADQTGGVFISVDQATDLEDAMKNAITSVSDDKYQRTLFTYRYTPKLDLLYAFMRIIFLSLLGFVVSFCMLFCTGKGEDDRLIFFSSIISAVLGALLVELGINMIELPAFMMHLIYDILIALMFIHTKEYTGKRFKEEVVQPRKKQVEDDDFGDFNELL